MMVRTSLRPGFRFHPTDVELVKYYLKRKVMGKNDSDVISEINIYKYSPWDLPDKSCLRSKDLEWYFFCPKETKNANGVRRNRATDCGYWKPTGKDRDVSYGDQTVAKIKSLIFHKGHARKGERTNWVMHEYRMLDKKLEDAGVVQDAYVLCKVFQKSGLGPQNGAQYGARFNENDYDDDGEIIGESSLPVAPPPPALPSNNSGFLSRSTSSGPLGGSVYFPGSTGGPLSDSVFVPGSTYSGIFSDSVFDPGSTSIGPLSDRVPSEPMLCADEVPPPMPYDSDELSSMLDKFREDYSSLPREDDNNEVENFGHVTHNEGLACLHGIGSGDLYDNWAESSGGGFSLCSPETTGLGLTLVLAGNDSDFLELKDLDGQLDPALDQSPLQSPLGSDSFSPTLIKGDPPPAETTKLNTDGCWLQGNGKAGFGGLFQNKEGVWMLDFYGKVECNSSLEAELWGIYRGLTIMLEKGMTNIMIETYSHEAVKLITGGPDPSCPYRALVDGSRLLMIRTSSSLSHISREADEYADYLARRGAEQDEHLVVCEY